MNLFWPGAPWRLLSRWGWCMDLWMSWKCSGRSGLLSLYCWFVSLPGNGTFLPPLRSVHAVCPEGELALSGLSAPILSQLLGAALYSARQGWCWSRWVQGGCGAGSIFALLAVLMSQEHDCNKLETANLLNWICICDDVLLQCPWSACGCIYLFPLCWWEASSCQSCFGLFLACLSCWHGSNM